MVSLHMVSLSRLQVPGLQGPVATVGVLLTILALILLAALVVAIWK